MRRVLFALMFAATAHAELPVARIDRLPEQGIIITAVEFKLEPKFTCEVFYWHPQDENQDGKIESCKDVAYNPCEANDGDRQLIRFVLGGGSCTQVEPPDCSFSPQPAGCSPP